MIFLKMEWNIKNNFIFFLLSEVLSPFTLSFCLFILHLNNQVKNLTYLKLCYAQCIKAFNPLMLTVFCGNLHIFKVGMGANISSNLFHYG